MVSGPSSGGLGGHVQAMGSQYSSQSRTRQGPLAGFRATEGICVMARQKSQGWRIVGGVHEVRSRRERERVEVERMNEPEVVGCSPAVEVLDDNSDADRVRVGFRSPRLAVSCRWSTDPSLVAVYSRDGPMCLGRLWGAATLSCRCRCAGCLRAGMSTDGLNSQSDHWRPTTWGHGPFS